MYVYRRQRDERFGAMKGNNVTVYVEPGERIRDSDEMRPVGPVPQVLYNVNITLGTSVNIAATCFDMHRSSSGRELTGMRWIHVDESVEEQ
jgi:hypothetical protein